MATINIGSLSFTHKGDYASGTAYVKNDVVYYATNGNAYVAKQATQGNAPTNATYWSQFAQGSGGIWSGALPLGSAEQIVQVNSAGNALEFTAKPEGKIKAFSRFALTGLSTLSATTSEYYFWTVTYNRQYNGDLWIVSDIPASELPNGPYVGPHIRVVAGSTTVKGSRGLKWFRPNNDNTELGFNSYFTASELGSTTGNITISHGWNWGGGATSSTLPITYINLGYSPNGTQQLDARVPNAGNTEGHMMVMEF